VSLKILLNLFFSGVILGGSVCTLWCGWVFLPFVFEKETNIKKSLGKFFLFHSGKIVSYTIAGGLVGYSASFVSNFKNSSISILSAALFFLALGILNFFVPESFRVKMKKRFVCFSGFLVAFIPCSAFISVLVYIAYVASDFLQGAISGFVFGLGNLINPLIIISMLALPISRKFEKILKNTRIFKFATGSIFIFWSGTLFWRVFQ